MSLIGYCILLSALLATKCLAADEGDDFANNLFSDLAPLLTLFGERVTMQFMSQSMGWADNIILAMAPLGIITAIVGAIRVGGPTWLKAVIGRARENLAVAEAELMSSTSHEVCELWNGQGIVRCMGSAPVVEFICLLPENLKSQNNENIPEIIVVSFEEAKNEHIIEIDLSLREDLSRWRSHRQHSDPENTQEKKSSKGQKIIIIPMPTTEAPNISLNSHPQSGRGRLRAAAAFGTVLQLGVLLYSGFATYYPNLKFLKDDKPIAGYAYPCTAAATLILVAGMMTCAHVVESSTTEKHYQPKNGSKARVVWLQQMKTVSDQVFNSCVIYAKDDRNFVTTSRRRTDKGNHLTADGKKGSSTDRRTFLCMNWKLSYLLTLEIITVVGTVVTLMGFIFQFIGLRAMHWSASIAQLSAVLVMVLLKAAVRWGLAQPPQSQSLTSGFELDWFAKALGELHADKPSRAPCFGGQKKPSNNQWTIVVDGNSELHDTKPSENASADACSVKAEEFRQNGRPVSKAHAVLEVRKNLAREIRWRGPASVVAVSLARAIEVTMDALFGHPAEGGFLWSLEARYVESKGPLPIYFRLQRKDGRWKANADEFDAALSLWLSSINEEEKKKAAEPSEKTEGDVWLRAEGSSGERSLRLLGSNTPYLLRDLRWWVPKDLLRIFEVGVGKEGLLEVETHRIIGPGWHKDGNTTEETQMTRCERKDLNLASKGPADDGNKTGSKAALAAESYGPLRLLFAQDMFSTFMRAAAMKLEKPIDGGAEVRPNNDSDSWKSFTLRNTKLSTMAQDIHSTGLGSLEDIYLSLVPPLSEKCKLPRADIIIELAREHAKRHEQLGHWEQASDAYLWLFRIAKDFNGQDVNTKATAVLMEHLRQVTSAFNLSEGEDDHRDLKRIKSDLEKEIQLADPEILSSLMGLYKKQGRGWSCDLIAGPETESDLGVGDKYPQAFNFTKLHQAVQSSQHWVVYRMLHNSDNENATARDIHNWTPLHYAVAVGGMDTVDRLLQQGADVNACDLVEWTPLHYACRHRRQDDVVHLLIKEGADINAQGRDGQTPLHCAAAAKDSKRQAMNALIEAGANIDIMDALGNTPLFLAARLGHADAIEKLWGQASKRLRDKLGRNALHIAAAVGQKKVVKWLLTQKEMDIQARDRRLKTALHWAASNGHAATMKLLIKQGADIQTKEEFQKAPLHLAAMNGHRAALELLIDSGADVNAKDRNGWTSLHWAALEGHVDALELLLKKCADIETGHHKGWGRTALNCAVWGNHVAALELLIRKEADVEDKDGDDDDRVPLLWAARRGRVDAVELLIKGGANMQAQDEQGEKALQIIIEKLNEAIEEGREGDVKRFKEIKSLLE